MFLHKNQQTFLVCIFLHLENGTMPYNVAVKYKQRSESGAASIWESQRVKSSVLQWTTMASTVYSLLVILIEHCGIIKYMKDFHSWLGHRWWFSNTMVSNRRFDLEEVLSSDLTVGKKIEVAQIFSDLSFSSIALPREKCQQFCSSYISLPF